jgi:hypothetical protein
MNANIGTTYFFQDCNTGGDYSPSEVDDDEAGGECGSAGVDATELMAKIDAAFMRLLEAEGNRYGETVCGLYASSQLEIMEQHGGTPGEGEGGAYTSLENSIIETIAGARSAHKKTKHAKQNALIVREMLRYGIIRQGVELSRATRTSEEPPTSITVVVEMGAGKGRLGQAVAMVAPRHTRVVLVERSAGGRTTGKAERYFREVAIPHKRLRMDIKDCFLGGIAVPDASSLPSQLTGVENSEGIELNDGTSSHQSLSVTGQQGERKKNESTQSCLSDSNCKVVVIAKHLCGVATDLALQSLTRLSTSMGVAKDKNGSSSSSQSEDKSGQDKRDGQLGPRGRRALAIAPCCHHACLWKHYTGRQFLRKNGFTGRDFGVMKLWSGWFGDSQGAGGGGEELGVGAVGELSEEDEGEGEGGDEDERDEGGNDKDQSGGHSAPAAPRVEGISQSRRTELGIRIKLLLDAGRLDFIRTRLGMTVGLTEYCSRDLSPENRLLLAVDLDQ